MHDESKRAIVAAFLANLGIAIAKLVGFVITGASSMLAESVHSLADTGNQGLLVLGGRQAARPATPEHPFGYGRDRYFWAFVVAMVLETFSLRTAVKASHSSRKGQSWVAFIRRSKSPELPVVLLEDLGALVGLAFAFIGVALAVITDEPRFDGAATLAIGALLVVIAVILVMEMKSLLIGESATPEDQRRIQAKIEGAPHVSRLLHMRTLHLGPDELLVAAKVEFAGDLTVPAIAAAIDACEARIRAAVPTARVIYLEPDLLADTAPPPATEAFGGS